MSYHSQKLIRNESLHLKFKNKVHKGTFNGKRYQNTLLQMLPRDTILHLEYVNKGDLWYRLPKRNHTRWKDFWMRKGKPLYIPLTYLALYSNSNSFSINEHILPTISEYMKLAIFKPNLCVIYMQYVYALKKKLFILILYFYDQLWIYGTKRSA